MHSEGVYFDIKNNEAESLHASAHFSLLQHFAFLKLFRIKTPWPFKTQGMFLFS